jgi:putative transposase
MPNHIHLIAVPGKKENLRLAIGEAYRRYIRRINFREGWRGHFWQEPFLRPPAFDYQRRLGEFFGGNNIV